MTTGRKKVLALSGSTRRNSTNEVILSYLAESGREFLDTELFTGLTELPYFNPDTDKGEVPQSVTDFRTKIEEADGVIICSPEYVFSLPGVLKNAIEWTVSTNVFTGKPVALIIASGLGEKAFESMHLIMTTIQARVKDETCLLIRGARARVNPEGRLSDEETRQQLDSLVRAFVQSMENKDDLPG